MKTFSGANAKPLNRKKASACAGLNVHTPGLGSLMAGRYLVGVLQLGAAIPGFFLLMKWMFAWTVSRIFGSIPPPSWQLKSGLILFVGAWLGALWTSIHMIRNATPDQTPPKLDGSPG